MLHSPGHVPLLFLEAIIPNHIHVFQSSQLSSSCFRVLCPKSFFFKTGTLVSLQYRPFHSILFSHTQHGHTLRFLIGISPAFSLFYVYFQVPHHRSPLHNEHPKTTLHGPVLWPLCTLHILRPACPGNVTEGALEKHGLPLLKLPNYGVLSVSRLQQLIIPTFPSSVDSPVH